MSESMSFSFEFITPLKPIEVEETHRIPSRTLIGGTLLVEGMTKNGNLYTLDEMESIAKGSEGVDIKFGTATRANPNTGDVTPNMHDIREKSVVGKIISTMLDPIQRKILFIAEIFNTKENPHIAETVTKNWGISIRGVAKGAEVILDKVGRIVRKIVGMKIQDVQLVTPETPRGQDAAKVEEVEIQETLIMDFPPLTYVDIVKALIIAGKIKV